MGRKATNVIAATTESIKKAIKDAAGRRIEYRVAGQPGLVLLTTTVGAGTFYLFYSPPGVGKARKLKLGTFPALTLKQASTMALEARARITRGDDPFAQKSQQKASLTVAAVVDRYLTEALSLSMSTRLNYGHYFKAELVPSLGPKPIATVTSDDILAICHRIRGRGHLVQSDRVRGAISGLFNWAVSEGLVKSNPAREVPRQQTHRAARTRTPTDAELRVLWNAIHGSHRLSPSIRLIIKLAILTGQRRKEVAGARVSELAGDTWIIPGDVAKAGRIVTEGRMKNGSEQRIFLSTQAKALFDEAGRTTAVADILFPADPRRTKSGKTRHPHVHGDSVSQAMARVCADAGIADLTIHDMRRAIGNFLKNAGYSRDVRDLVLHHKDPSVTGVHYDASARMEPQCRAAWQAWADHVSKISSLIGDQVETV